ncbi:vWA domain-containing protein [Roseobacter sp. EG26]|uniref:vWA domain-containing protein n=1 Tax=Roseobacter sp. EG26 TaxID=3412477 RepID=UPI003CE4F2C1
MTALDFTLLRPMWLLALPVLGIAAWWLAIRRGGLGDWQRAADTALLQAMTALGRVDNQASRGPLWAILTVVLISVVALAGPALERRDTLSFRNLDGVVFVVDVSGSVTEHSNWPQLQTMGRFGLASLGTRPGALIVFAGDAYVATDMTLDHLQLGQTFSLLDAALVPDRGSRPERALALAVQLLSDAQVIAGDVILLTDGAGLGPASLRETAAISELGARVSLISIDTPTAAFDTHARAGGGEVFALDQSETLLRWLQADARTRLEAQDYPLLFWKDMGRYLLALALLPLLLLFRRRPS